MIRERQREGQRERPRKKMGIIRIHPAHKHKCTGARSFLQAKTEAVARAVWLCELWAVRSQVRPTQSPFSRTVCSNTHTQTHTGYAGARMADGTKRSSCMHAKIKQEHAHIYTCTHTDRHTYTHTKQGSSFCQKSTLVPVLPLHYCPLPVKDKMIIGSSHSLSVFLLFT